MGVGALLKTLNLLFPLIFKNEMNNKWEKIKDLEVSNFKQILSGLESVNFRTDGPYGRTGSAGSINKIKEEIIKSLAYTGYPKSFQDFEALYKQTYLPNFNAALENHLSHEK